MSEDTTRKEFEVLNGQLMNPPSSVAELLRILDNLYKCLVKLEKPELLSTTMKSILVGQELLHHKDVDVKVAVAACLSETIKLTSPNPAYSLEMLKEIFSLIVSSFKNLDDISSPSYEKRIAILQSVNEVNAWAVMVGLRCNYVILDMFQIFLKTIRDYHPRPVFSSMRNIMTHVLPFLPSHMIIAILPYLRNRKCDEVPQVSRKLAEQVLRYSAKSCSCLTNFKNCLRDAVRSSYISLEGYSDIVASLCEGTLLSHDHHQLTGNEKEIPTKANERVKEEEGVMSEDDSDIPDTAFELLNGWTLADPPYSADGLLPVLENIYNCLLKLKESELDLYWFVLYQSMRLLAEEEFLNHEDVHVRVAVAACHTETMYFTSPDMPFTRQQLEEVFNLIGSTFEDLDDQYSPSYSKRISILQTFDLIDAWELPVEFNNYPLLLKMPQTFLTTIRDYHPEEVFSSMRNIIINVLPYLPKHTLTTILPYLRKGDEVPQVSRKLAEQVLSNFAKFSFTLTNFKNCLTEVVRSSGLSLEDYSDIVASLCEGTLFSNDHQLTGNEKEDGDSHLTKEAEVEACFFLPELFGFHEEETEIEQSEQEDSETGCHLTKEAASSSKSAKPACSSFNEKQL